MTFRLAMRRGLLKTLLTAVMLIGVTALFAQDGKVPPRPTDGPVLEAGVDVLSAAEENRLKAKLRAYEDTTSTQIAVLVINNLDGRDPNEYAQDTGETWGVGQKGKENGVIIVVAIDDRQWSIQTGYGAEGAVTDGLAGRIGDKHMTPNFKQGNYYAGLDGATTEIMQRLSGEYTPSAAEEAPFWVKIIPVLIIVLIVFLIIKFGNKGGGNFTNMDRGGRRTGRYGSPWIFPTGTGGGGFGGGGGGWGGFGGGSFGGGGASGGW